MVADDADGEVRTEAETPDDGEGGEQGAAHGPAWTAEGVESGEGAERVGPSDVDEAVVIEATGDEIKQSEAGAERGEGEQEKGGGGHGRRCEAFSFLFVLIFLRCGEGRAKEEDKEDRARDGLSRWWARRAAERRP